MGQLKLMPTKEGDDARTFFAKDGLSTSTGGGAEAEDKDEPRRERVATGAWKRRSEGGGEDSLARDAEDGVRDSPGLAGSTKTKASRGSRMRKELGLEGKYDDEASEEEVLGKHRSTVSRDC